MESACPDQLSRYKVSISCLRTSIYCFDFFLRPINEEVVEVVDETEDDILEDGLEIDDCEDDCEV